MKLAAFLIASALLLVSCPAESHGFASCAAAASMHATPLHRGDTGWNPDLDRDGDGVACE